MPVEFRIIDGTDREPEGIAGLCTNCVNAQIIKGRSLTDLRVFCVFQRWGEPPMQITTRVTRCSAYMDNKQPSQQTLEKRAWTLINDGHGHIKFVPPTPD